MRLIMKIIKYISITIMTMLTFICIFVIMHLNFLIKLPFENERYFDKDNDVVYHSQSILGFGFLLLLCISLIIITIIIIIVINKRINGK